MRFHLMTMDELDLGSWIEAGLHLRAHLDFDA